MDRIKPEHVKRFKRYANQLNKLMTEITEYNPEANLYAEDSWNLNLMEGPTHGDDRNQSPLHDNVVECVTVYTLGGGGW